jgi:hypothetical protein
MSWNCLFYIRLTKCESVLWQRKKFDESGRGVSQTCKIYLFSLNLDIDIGFSSQLDNVGKLDSLGSSLVELIDREDTKTRFSNLEEEISLAFSILSWCNNTYTTYQFLSFVDLGTLESDNNGDVKIKILGSSDNTLGNNIASHDTTKDVDECRWNLKLPMVKSVYWGF